MQAWRADTKAQLHVTRKERATKGAFTYDAKRYLPSVKALITYTDRVRDVAFWCEEFGDRQRGSITSAEIRAVKDRLLTEPRSDDDKRPLAAGTVNKRLRALSNIFTVLDGSQGYNPVRDVPEAREPDPQPRALDYDTIARIIACLPDAGQPARGEKRSTVSKAKVRIRCFAYDPITPAQMKQLHPADLDLEAGRLRAPARAKGRGAKAVWRKLTEQAWDAFRDFNRLNLYGSFSLRNVRRAFTHAASRAGAPTARLYDLRHSFGTAVYRATRSLGAVGLMLQHADPRTSAGYALKAQGDVTDAIVGAVGQHIGTTGVAESGQSWPKVADTKRSLTPIPTHSRGGRTTTTRVDTSR